MRLGVEPWWGGGGPVGKEVVVRRSNSCGGGGGEEEEVVRRSSSLGGDRSWTSGRRVGGAAVVRWSVPLTGRDARFEGITMASQIFSKLYSLLVSVSMFVVAF